MLQQLTAYGNTELGLSSVDVRDFCRSQHFVPRYRLSAKLLGLFSCLRSLKDSSRVGQIKTD